ncbi:DUF167 family protein [Cellvibrio polysaccharolyticus]|uniref:UPF0235 protein C4F51_00360 n=1 Tax=Cellvibrio polysaccharolyticus TaxID=2082724 RepID=A0A928V3V0_9GAMM|nr:DUF167 family protein [Cellvibrio polysaccharolyticus]MBE8715639.1 YggU family protein [Cellvibrio polysaccharolyticus]
MTHYQWQGSDLLLRCHLQPKASNDGVAGLHGDRIKLRITAPPVDGKANAHLVQWLGKLFQVPKSRVTILQGESGRSKNILIQAPAFIPAEFAINSLS